MYPKNSPNFASVHTLFTIWTIDPVISSTKCSVEIISEQQINVLKTVNKRSITSLQVNNYHWFTSVISWQAHNMPLTNNLRKYFFLSITHCTHTVPYIVALACDICIKLCRISCTHFLSALCMLQKLLAAHYRKVRIRRPIPMPLHQYPRAAVENTEMPLPRL